MTFSDPPEEINLNEFLQDWFSNTIPPSSSESASVSITPLSSEIIRSFPNTPADSADEMAINFGIQTWSQRKLEGKRPRACDVCRSRKTKCLGNAGQPCAYCQKMKKVCSREGVPVHDATKIPIESKHPPLNYAQALEARLQALVTTFKDLATQSNVSLNELDWELVDEIDLDENSGSPWDMKVEEIRQKLHQKTSTTQNLLSNDSNTDSSLSVDRTSLIWQIRDHHFLGHSSGAVLVRMIISNFTDLSMTWLEKFSNNVWYPNAPELNEGKRVKSELPCYFPENMLNMILSKTEDDVDATSDMRRSLIDAYFLYVNPIFPVVHRNQFEREYLAGHYKSNSSFRALTWSMMALGARHVFNSNDPCYTQKTIGRDITYPARGWKFFIAARNHIKAVAFLPSTLLGIQSHTLLVLWLCTGCFLDAAWIPVGLALRQAIDAGIHVEASYWKHSVMDDQMRKRVFHILIHLDRTISDCSGRPVTFREYETDLQYPLDLTDEDLEEWDNEWQRARQINPEAPIPPAPKCRPNSQPGSVEMVIQMSKLQKITVRIGQLLFGNRELSSRVRLYGRTKDIKRLRMITIALDFELEEWYRALPSGFLWDPTASDTDLLRSLALHSHFYSAQLLLHRDWIITHVASFNNKLLKPTMPPKNSINLCTWATKHTIEMYKIAEKRGLLPQTALYSPPHIGVAGLISLGLAVLKKQEAEVSIHVTDEYETLTQCSKLFQVLRDYHPFAQMCHKEPLSLLKSDHPNDL